MVEDAYYGGRIAGGGARAVFGLIYFLVVGSVWLALMALAALVLAVMWLWERGRGWRRSTTT